uniref:Clathrin/coatomer adaptor adaptin-like N-terminal domain-containing protein n=1 Tax=Guillardia theta TaxID=55529 RepID=A0A7S4P6S8_GUITH|mmetsp:Transcript_44472/g.140314  ORF Transcript_44472/g.140314 Transcript_44472/m.140314 type:complete len:870 (+) Transcript_44472:72-2681(+)
MAMRGLTQFIGDIRNCANKEEERKRVDKEMANIRKHFKEATKLTAYQKKKYVWKMLYIYVLGYEVDFGHMEALNLITAQGYSEKMVGYLACVLLLSETNEFLRLIINSVKNDLMSANEEIQGLALACVANVGGREFAETLAGDVQRILLSNHSRPQARKKAALCMLRLLRKYPDAFGEDGIGGNQDQRDSLYDLLEDPSLGVVTATMSLLIGLVSHNPELWTDSVNKCCKLLSKLNHPNAAKEFGQEYVYYKTINPWLQVKILRLLQYYPPPERHEVHTKLCDVLLHIISDAQMQKNVNTNNSAHSVVFEAINYVIHMETNKELISSAVSMLGQRMTASNQPNYRYLALDAMQRMSHIPDAAQQFKKHQETIIKSLKDNDVSLRRRALDVLYSMCDSKNSEQVVGELLDYLQGGDYAIREELVLRVAILAERFSPNLQWYVDTILKLMTLAGDYVSDHIWMRVVQIVTNNEELQLYAAETCYRSLKSESVHESMIKCGGYILGEFGHHIAHKNETSPDNQFMILKEKFHACEQWETKQILISSCVKLVNVHPQIKGAVVELLKKHTTTIDAELQQRAIEYLALTAPGKETMLETVLDVMPNFPERESILTKKIKERERVSTTDRTAAQIKSEQNKDDEDGPQTVDLSASAVKSSASRAKSQLSPSQNPHNDLLDLTAEEPSHMGGGGGGGGLSLEPSGLSLKILLLNILGGSSKSTEETSEGVGRSSRSRSWWSCSLGRGRRGRRGSGSLRNSSPWHSTRGSLGYRGRRRSRRRRYVFSLEDLLFWRLLRSSEQVAEGGEGVGGGGGGGRFGLGGHLSSSAQKLLVLLLTDLLILLHLQGANRLGAGPRERRKCILTNSQRVCGSVTPF